MTRDLRSRVDHWRNIAAQDDSAAARTIRDDDLDILIDLSGHSARSRILLFNQRCAPVQATWLGYLNTTGLRSVDFRICDRHTDPLGTAEAFNTEALLRLPDSQWCYLPVFDAPSAPAREPRSPERVVFGSFNHASKMSDRCIDLWCRVLRAVPGSVIRVFAVPPGQATAALRQRFERQGIDGGRVALHPRTSIDAYFAAIGDVDIALDTFPYNGGTTTFDVLWMQVPLVALAGDRPAARSGVSILVHAGSARTDRRRRRRLCRHQRPAGHRRTMARRTARIAAGPDAGVAADGRGPFRPRIRGRPPPDARHARPTEGHEGPRGRPGLASGRIGAYTPNYVHMPLMRSRDA